MVTSSQYYQSASWQNDKGKYQLVTVRYESPAFFNFLLGFRNKFWQGFRNQSAQGFRIVFTGLSYRFWQGFRTEIWQGFRIVLT